MTDQLSAQATSANHIELAAEVVSAFVSNNSVPVAELPALIGSVHSAPRNVGHPAPKQEEAKPTPPVPIRRSVTPDYLISLEDGKQYRSLKRHLAGRGLTPEQYREKWGLPRDYPMVASSYSAKRSELAKSLGLGQQRKNAAKAAATSETIKAKVAKKRGRKMAK
jgi:predicted transcriptional regulator